MVRQAVHQLGLAVDEQDATPAELDVERDLRARGASGREQG